MKKLFLLLLVVSFVVGFESWNGHVSITKSSQKTAVKIKTTESSIPLSNVAIIPKTISIIGVGDIMLGSNYPSEKYLPVSGKNILTEVENITENSDITFGNLEGPILTSGGSPKTGKYCFSFRMPDNYVNYLKDARFNIISLANNHSCDFGKLGRENTMKLLKKNGIKFAGLKEVPYTIFEKDGVKYGFCAFAPNYSGVMHFDEANKIIKELDSQCDIVIVSFHAGAEGQNYQHITRSTEYFLGENRGNPYKLARDAIDNGADVVFMSGPHVTRAIDLYKDRFIAYSLGDFATYGQFNTSGACGISPIIKIIIDKQGKFLRGTIYPIKLIGRGIPVIDENRAVIKKIIDLTKIDIPEAKLIIKDDGTITRGT